MQPNTAQDAAARFLKLASSDDRPNALWTDEEIRWYDSQPGDAALWSLEALKRLSKIKDALAERRQVARAIARIIALPDDRLLDVLRAVHRHTDDSSIARMQGSGHYLGIDVQDLDKLAPTLPQG